MTVPSFQIWFLPLLRRLADGNDHKMTDLFQQLADALGLTAGDRAELLSSGKQLTYKNRIGWARTYLKKAGLVEDPSRGTTRITKRGRDVLADNPTALNVSFLRGFAEFRQFHAAAPSGAQAPDADNNESPEDTPERVSGELRRALALELLDRIKAASPDLFERLVVDLLLKMGYGGSRKDAGEVLGKAGDGGVDGVIKEDRLGLDAIYVQAKKWENVVGRPIVQAFAGSLEGVRAHKGVLITTSSFSAEAKAYVGNIGKKIVLIDGPQLANFMIEHDLAVTKDVTYVVKKIDLDYFED